jgi:putative NADH-flavin reductase
MRVVVFGASGPTGKLVVKQGLEYGFQITAAVRNPDTFEVKNPAVTVVKADVYDPAAVSRAIAGQEVVISTYGVPYSFKHIDAYSVGIKNIIRSMQEQNVKRLICVTSGGTKPGIYDANTGFFFSVLMRSTIGRTLYADMRLMEELVMKSNLDWTIARPAQLFNDPQLTSYEASPGYTLPKGVKTRRIDLANFLLKEAQANKFVKQGVAVVTWG